MAVKVFSASSDRLFSLHCFNKAIQYLPASKTISLYKTIAKDNPYLLLVEKEYFVKKKELNLESNILHHSLVYSVSHLYHGWQYFAKFEHKKVSYTPAYMVVDSGRSFPT